MASKKELACVLAQLLLWCAWSAWAERSTLKDKMITVVPCEVAWQSVPQCTYSSYCGAEGHLWRLLLLLAYFLLQSWVFAGGLLVRRLGPCL